MAKQLQLRRGSTIQNDAFTGAVGELTLDTDTGQIRIHNGTSQGGGAMIDPIVDYQLPDANNNYTWYRLYASGWVEMGGVNPRPSASTANVLVSLPIEMADSNYNITANVTDSTAYSSNTTNATIDSATIRGVATNRRSTTGFYISYASSGFDVLWEVKGLAAHV